MGRKPRIHVPGGFYHVILRGNAHQDVFREDADRRRFCQIAEDGTGRFNNRIHAFCLMNSHVHLVTEVGNSPLPVVLHNLASRYSHWMNHKYSGSGHVFQGRYKALMVDVDSYLLELVRYVHLNPVRAGLVGDASEFKWSSHRAYLDYRCFPWVSTRFVLRMFARSIDKARKLYRDFVEMSSSDSAHHRTRGDESQKDLMLEDESFSASGVPVADESAGDPFDFEILVRIACKEYGVDSESISSRSRSRLLSEVRAVLALYAREVRTPSLSELGRRLGRDASTLSHSARRLELRATKDVRLAERLRAIRKAAVGETERRG